MNLNERAEMAVQRKNSGKYNCAQAVTTALADQTGLQEEQMKQISAGFCAGMGNMQATCGALIGAGMIAGLKTEGKGTLKVTRQIQEAFQNSDELSRRLVLSAECKIVILISDLDRAVLDVPLGLLG